MADIPHAVWTNAEEKLDAVEKDVTATGLQPSVRAALDMLDLLIQIYVSD
jgi:hypothetical protein